jgi:hypothetical protein
MSLLWKIPPLLEICQHHQLSLDRGCGMFQVLNSRTPTTLESTIIISPKMRSVFLVWGRLFLLSPKGLQHGESRFDLIFCNNSRRTGISIYGSQGEGLKDVNDYELLSRREQATDRRREGKQRFI